MPKNVIGDPPFPPVEVLDKDDLFTMTDLNSILSNRPSGVTICLRYKSGPAARGGYFFHFAPSKNAGDFTLYDFEKRPVKDFSPEALVAFINHCSGRRFDEASFILCQTELNFLKDE
jgi:hypothetical protein